jgi:hypothetical protein
MARQEQITQCSRRRVRGVNDSVQSSNDMRARMPDILTPISSLSGGKIRTI